MRETLIFFLKKNSHAFATSSTCKTSLKGFPVPHNFTTLFFFYWLNISFLLKLDKNVSYLSHNYHLDRIDYMA